MPRLGYIIPLVVLFTALAGLTLAEAATSTFAPSLDGQIQRVNSGSGDSWSDIRDGLGTHPNDTALSFAAWAQHTSDWERVVRGVVIVDLSALVGRTVKGVELDLVPVALVDDLAPQSVVLVAVTPASDTVLVASDYEDGFGTPGTFAKLSDEIALADMALSATFTLTLNAAGEQLVQDALDTDGIVRLGFVLVADADDTEPGGLAGPGVSARVAVAANGHPNDAAPVLRVKHTGPPS